MQIVVKAPAFLRGYLRPPGDKSISHRSAIIGALAEGTTIINGFLKGTDCLNTLQCLRAMGVLINGPEAGQVTVSGRGLFSLQEPKTVLDAGNSGTTMRLLLGILAGQKFYSVLNGDASLRCRPMDRVIEPLKAMGAEIWGRQEGKLAPISIKGGNLRPIHYSLPVASAQVKTALLLAGLYTSGETVIIEPSQSRDHSERILKAAGAAIYTEGKTIRLKGGKSLKPLLINVPGDISAAAFFLVAGAVHPRAKIKLINVNLNPTRTGIVDVLKAMDARIEIVSEGEEGIEPVGSITVTSGNLRGTKIAGEIIPRLIDEIPILAVAAAVAKGETVIRNAAELKLKESDRIAVTAAELTKMGANIKPLPDGLWIKGGSLYGAEVDSHGDHRLGMALAIAALAAKGRTVIHGAECISVSYPNFINDLKSLGAEVGDKD